MRESIPFLALVKREKELIIVQVSVFEGNLYPCYLGAAIDYGDAIHDALGWRDIGRIDFPMQIEGQLSALPLTAP